MAWRDYLNNLRNTISNDYNKVSNFVRQNPTPVSFVNRNVVRPVMRANDTIQRSPIVRTGQNLINTMSGVNATKQLGSQIHENIVRPFAQKTMQVANTITGNKQFTPEGKVQKFFYGDKPVTNIQGQNAYNKQVISPYTGKSSKVLAPIVTGLGIMGALDPVGGTGKTGKLVNALTKIEDINKIKKLTGVTDEIAQKIAKTKDAKEIAGHLGGYLDQAGNFLKKDVAKVVSPLSNEAKTLPSNLKKEFPNTFNVANKYGLSEKSSANDIVNALENARSKVRSSAGGTGLNNQEDVNAINTYIEMLDQNGIKSRNEIELARRNLLSSSQPLPTPPLSNEAPNVPLTPKNATEGIVRASAGQGKGVIKNTRSFPETVKQSEFVSPEVSKTVKNQLYTVRNTEELGIKAKNLVDTYPNIALDMANSPKIDDQVVAVSNELIKKYSYSTNPAEIQTAVDLTEKLAPKLTEAGRTVQAASLINRLSPEGVLVFTQRQLNKAVKINPKFEGKISNETALKLTEMTKEIQKMPEGYEKTLKTAELYKEIQDLIPVSIGKKISTLQTMAQLLNPKTIVRNLVGNTGFAGQEAVSQTLATPIDRLVGLFTGKKTVSLPNPITQGKSFIKAGGQAAREAGLGVNTSNLTSQFELNQVPVFKNKMLATAEKGLNYALRVTDRAAYSAAFDDTLQGLMKTNKVSKPEEWMLEAAHQTGLYRTFQDSSNTAKLFTKIKSGLNFGKDFGLGDFVLKYPKTPANIISRGIDYSPAGYVKALYNLAFIKNPANQREFSMGLARATTGTTSLVGLGALLGGMGIITEAPQKDKDLRNLQKKTGLGGYQLNLSALKRYFNSGFNKDSAQLQPNDTLVTYDWFQPAAIGLSMGAKIANNMKSGKNPTNDLTGIVTESINSGVTTLAEQPLMRGVTNLVSGYGGLVENLKDTASQSLASFVPTISNQLAQLKDTDQSGHTKVRDVSSLSFVDEAIKKVQTKIPFLREKLPQGVDVMGDPMVYSSKAGILSTFVTPYFLSNYTPTPEIKELFNLMDITGEKKQFPRTVEKSVDINGKNIKLQDNQVRDYQTYVGQKTQNILGQLLNDPRYTSLDDTGKVNRISTILTDINAAAKIELFGNQPKTVDSGVKAILAETYYMGKESTPKTAKVTSKKTTKSKGKKKISLKQAFKGPTSISKPTVGKTLLAPSKNLKKSYKVTGGLKNGAKAKVGRLKIAKGKRMG